VDGVDGWTANDDSGRSEGPSDKINFSGNGCLVSPSSTRSPQAASLPRCRDSGQGKLRMAGREQANQSPLSSCAVIYSEHKLQEVPAPTSPLRRAPLPRVLRSTGTNTHDWNTCTQSSSSTATTTTTATTKHTGAGNEP
jgi:hypothetical protein